MVTSKSSSSPKEIITGYYRYTDIWFAWNDCLSAEDGRAIKAIFSHDALVHPDHPFHIDGVEGLSMFIGTMESSGESRLLFSTKQVDYARYWLHAVGQTKHEIPLPYSDCLILRSQLRTVSPVNYKTGGDLKTAVKKISKNNKKLKGTNPELHARRDAFERVRSCYAQRQGTWLAIDIEAWERDHTVVKELGYSSVTWKDGVEVAKQGHFDVKEYQSYRNTTWVASYPEHFHFGTTEVLSKSVFKTRIAKLVEESSQDGPLFLVFHDANEDIKYLRSAVIGLPLTNLIYMLPDAFPDSGTFIVDTAQLFGALMGEARGNTRGLGAMANHLQIHVEHLHNAGNDAHATMLSLQEMSLGEPLDTQRERRWPNATISSVGTTSGAGVQVQLKEHDEDDYSDQEGVFPPVRGWDPVSGKMLAGPPEDFEDDNDDFL